jgi:hypothetical protein
MKKILLSITVMALLAFGCLTGCEDGGSDGDGEKFTLQGSIFDAVTGQRLTGDTLEVTMVRGTKKVTPNTLRKGDSETTFAGDYAFTNVPLPYWDANIEYRLVATLEGYQQFEAYINWEATWAWGEGPHEADCADCLLLDETYNMVGNIYMFPLGATANNVNVVVEYNGERVPEATVLLQQNIANNVETTPTNRLIAAGNGLLPALTAITDENGVAMFEGTLLTLGGNYTPAVLPMVVDGTQLAVNGVAAITVGAQNVLNDVLVTLEDVVPGTPATNSGAYIVMASNRDSRTVRTSGVLDLTFNKPIALVSETSCTAALANATTAVLDVADTVAATVSGDGLVLTMTPIFTTDPVIYDGGNAATADVNLQITYTCGGGITLAGDNDGVAMAILSGADDVNYLDGNDVSQMVQMTGPQTD